MADLLSDPYLLDPGPDGVNVLWHTDWAGSAHAVVLGPAVPAMSEAEAAAAASGPYDTGDGWRRVVAETAALRHLHDDKGVRRPVHRHWGKVDGLGLAAGAGAGVTDAAGARGSHGAPAARTSYRVVSISDDGAAAVSAAFTLAAAVPPDRPVRLLLTSDHQQWPNTAANLAKVAETVGVALDGVLMVGDMVRVPARASCWFDDPSGVGFLASLTGRADKVLGGRRYTGAPLLQHAPLFPAVGNHEVMGARAPFPGGPVTLDALFYDPGPGAWNTAAYEEMFPVPRAETGPRWWARRVGDVHLVSLFVTRAWRDAADTYAEPADRLADPSTWMHGQFLYDPVEKGSPQYVWLERELSSPAAREARVRVVMFHHASHGLGAHAVPAYTTPEPAVEHGRSGVPTAVRYHYPVESDVVLRDLAPLFAEAGVDLVVNGHSHLWNRFVDAAGVNWLETSNVGNSYGANPERGDPGGLAPVVPTVAPLLGPDGAPLPYVASNDVTVFSILDSADGVVRSYRFDVLDPDGPVTLFDELPFG